MKVLLIEDNDSLVHWLTRLLKEERFVVDTAPDGEAADQLLRTQQYDVVLLDLQIPRLSGKNVLRRLRARHNNVPVLMLTASGAVDEKVECLGLGADDYLVKPFEVRELLARIKALVRRQLGEKQTELSCGNLTYNSDTRQFYVEGLLLALRVKEHATLEILMQRQGKTVSKATLMDGIYAIEEDASEDAVEIYIHRIRKKLEGCQATIMTLRGLGYLLQQKQ
ncbi:MULTISPECIES: response regulator [Cupriavidus]|jgi:two-component system, OmpR family, response regulator TctD|uniref:Response regulator n=1 Tax=Cupriavidus metallidurans TaxID=119219 RepID=A0A482IZJ1_9BURK|nr:MULTISPECIES: response regulator [Cupriavidus]KWR81689.1 two-component system response regulator [Cupriavidus sp. SHE]QBP13013.1 response regulator [Cupriavidus metallidurans]QWC90802.1 response regulator [Cupriavidus metallidurans]UBM08412.1 response regulator [Cupriavidus metallidurans]